MSRRVVILTEIIAPYRVPVFNVLNLHPDIDLHVIFLAKTDSSLREWRVYEDEIRFSYEVLPSWRTRIGRRGILVNSQVENALFRAHPDAIVCGGYSYLASWQALRWARHNRVQFLLWCESTSSDHRKQHGVVESLKKFFVSQCDGFVVPGKSAQRYLEDFGVPRGDIFVARNAVDTALFAKLSDEAREHSAQLRNQLALPGRYFLYVGRLVREKGVLDVLAAYGQLTEELREEIGLVIVGDGPMRAELECAAREIYPGVVHFAGFAHREQLPAYYGLAECLVMPTHTDPWGLVVNEAMACALPVICTSVAGCAADLVRDNGKLIEPGDILQLHEAMSELARDAELRLGMGEKSATLIREYSPEAWATGMARAALSVGMA